jgi:hypothetical protein
VIAGQKKIIAQVVIKGKKNAPVGNTHINIHTNTHKSCVENTQKYTKNASKYTKMHSKTYSVES